MMSLVKALLNFLMESGLHGINDCELTGVDYDVLKKVARECLYDSDYVFKEHKFCYKLAHILLLFSWKLVGTAPNVTFPSGNPMGGVEWLNYIARYRDQKREYIGVDSFPEMMRRGEDQIEAEDLALLRRELHAAACSLIHITFFSAFSPGKLPLYVGLHHFLGAYGTGLCHVFAVGSGKFPHIESFFFNLERVYNRMWMKRPIPPNLELPKVTSTGELEMPGTNLSVIEGKTKCSICKKAISEFATLYPMAYSLSRNEACYPRKIFLSELDEDDYDQINEIEELDMTSEGTACSPRCMVQYLRSVILEVHLIIRDGGLPKFFKKDMDAPPFREFSKKVLKLLKQSNLHLFIRSALIPSTERVVLRRIPIHEMEWGICSPDYTDPRFKSARNMSKLSRMETLPMALQVANPWSVSKIFGLDGINSPRAVDALCKMRSRSPDGTSLLGVYRKRLAKMVIHGGQGNVSEEFTVRFIWRPQWGLVNDTTCDLPADQMIKLSFKRIKPMDALQPPDSVFDSVRKRLKKGEESKAADLVFPVRNSFVSLSNYVAGAKFRVGAESRAAKKLLARIGMDADCLLFARELDLRNKTCFGGFIVQEANCSIAIVIEDMYDLLMSEVSEFLLRKTFLKFEAAKWSLAETKYRPLKDQGSLAIPRADATRWAVAFYLNLVLCLRSVTQGDPDYQPGALKMLRGAPDFTIRLSLKNWRSVMTCLEKRVVSFSPKSAKSEARTFLRDLGMNPNHFKLETVESKRLVKVTPWHKIDYELLALATDDSRCAFVGKYYCNLSVYVDLAGLQKMIHLVAPRNRPVRELLRSRYGKRFDGAMVIRMQLEDLESRVRTVNLANDVTPESVMRQYGVRVDHLCLELTDDAAATAKSLNSHESLTPLSRVTSPPFGRTEFGDDHFLYSSHKIMWAGFTGLGEELQIPMMLTECERNELKSEDWKFWLKISKKLGRYLPYDFVFEGDQEFHRYIKKLSESKDAFELCVFFGSKQDPERSDESDDDCGSCRDLLAREMNVLGMPIQMAYIVIPFDEKTGVTAVLVEMIRTDKSGGSRAGSRYMKLIVPRKVQRLHLKRGSEIGIKERIKLLKSQPALTSEQAQGISTEYLAGYVTAVVGRQPVNFAVASTKHQTDDFGTLFRGQYEKFGKGNKRVKMLDENGRMLDGEMRSGETPFTRLDSNRRGYHVVLIVERSLVRDALRESLQDRYMVHHYLHSGSDEDADNIESIVEHKIGYDLTALVVCGPMEDVRRALLEKDADYFASGMLVLTEGCNLYLLPEEKRMRIAESLCSLESGALWKQVDLGHAVGPPFKGQEGVLRSACRPWECRNGDNEEEEEEDAGQEASKEEGAFGFGASSKIVDGAGAVGAEGTDAKSVEEKLKERRIDEARKILEARERFKGVKKLSPEEEMKKLREDALRLFVGTEESEDDDRLETCGHCGKVDFDMGFCGRCREAWYCDDECFRKDRKRHEEACKGKGGKGLWEKALEGSIQMMGDVILPDFDALKRVP